MPTSLIEQPRSQTKTPLHLTPAVCCVCRRENVDPVAVGQDFEYETSLDEFLAVRCRDCEVVYLHHRPAKDDAQRIYPDHYHAFQFRPKQFGLIYRVRQWLERRKMRSWCRGLSDDAAILDVGCGDGFHLDVLHQIAKPNWHIEGIDPDERAVTAARQRGFEVNAVELCDLNSGPFDLILLIMTVEHVSDPLSLLRDAAKRLKPAGRLVIVTDNTQTPDFALFGGRHWGGYHFPRHTYLFNRESLAKLATTAGFEVERLRSALSPVNWTYSFRNWLKDWGGPRWLYERFSLSSPLALAFFTLIDMPLSLMGRGGNLHAWLRKPGANHV